MQDNTNNLADKVALITGGAQRIGAVIAETLHAQGMRLVIHYHTSKQAAHTLQEKLNEIRAESVALVQANLLDSAKAASMVHEAANIWGRLDVVINNASSFYPTPIGSISDTQWDDLMGANLKAPFFIAQAAARPLAEHQGCIINVADIHGERPLKSYPVYSAAKAGLIMLTKALARELGPQVRVNAVAPGAIIWPESMDDVTKQRIISRVILKRPGNPQDIATTILFLIRDAGYITGQVIAVDGGRSVTS
ncbi:MAG TPA: pteridine reductase [Gammaproteobacteria bacterium]|nr:pteridine reductase [Gammaproteobacteria bacterium]